EKRPPEQTAPGAFTLASRTLLSATASRLLRRDVAACLSAAATARSLLRTARATRLGIVAARLRGAASRALRPLSSRAARLARAASASWLATILGLAAPSRRRLGRGRIGLSQRHTGHGH